MKTDPRLQENNDRSILIYILVLILLLTILFNFSEEIETFIKILN